EQRSALARRRAHLKDEVRIYASRAGKDAGFCVFAIGPCLPPGALFITAYVLHFLPCRFRV
ncbi:hypothetical protein, partial [Pantoea septica]|uniref:hypothetical protein n=1 Tax=Pantoea septica TaxID=472695 RepID=UPI00289DCEF5